jgi:hypothetical protein
MPTTFDHRLLRTRPLGRISWAIASFMVVEGTVVGLSAAAGCQVGAMSLVPKHTHLRVPTVYAGIPARRIA